jgi:hypothetical protein
MAGSVAGDGAVAQQQHIRMHIIAGAALCRRAMRQAVVNTGATILASATLVPNR